MSHLRTITRVRRVHLLEALSTMSCLMRTTCLVVGVLTWSSTPASAQRRAVWGVVTDNSSKPIAGAAVKLSNRVTLSIRSFITQADGKYRFGGLHPDMDYTVRAQKGGFRTKTQRLSHFDSRKVIQVDIRLDPGNKASN